ncbi:MAG: sensor histidine kinase, partial [Bacteroidota bacterium]
MLVYILTQLGWWAYLITELTKVVYSGSPKLDQRIWMVLGEGMVFASLLFIGFLYTYKAYKKEIELSRKQKNFLLSVTHEFKTPVASLRLFLETLQKRELDPQQKQEFISRAMNDIDRLNGITENILTAARIDMQVYPMNKTKISFSSLLEKITDSLSVSAGKDHITKKEIAKEIFVEADEQALISVVSNLYENAVKYSPKNSVIQVVLETRNQKAVLRIEDNGQGISEENTKKIFEKFYRVQDEETRTTKGTGLGLYITRFFVLQNGGEIKVKKNEPSGTIMEVVFDLA